MNNTMNKVVEIAQKRWNEVKKKEGWTKEDAVICALEIMDESGQFYDPTREEYNEAINSIY